VGSMVSVRFDRLLPGLQLAMPIWPLPKKTLAPPLRRCLTPLIQSHSDNPEFCIRSIHELADGSTVISDEYPFDSRTEIRLTPRLIFSKYGPGQGRRSRLSKGQN
jgi:hypothetical protein